MPIGKTIKNLHKSKNVSVEELGKTIRGLRKEKHITIEDLARRSGVAVATLSRIENGKMIGRVESHIRIAEVFGVTLIELYKGFYKKTLELVKDKVGHPVVGIHAKKFSSELLITDVHNKKIIPLIIKIEKGESTTTDKTNTGIDKFICMLQGEVAAHIGDEIIGLSGNDSIYFDSSMPHYFKNTGTCEARLVCIIAPPIL